MYAFECICDNAHSEAEFKRNSDSVDNVKKDITDSNCNLQINGVA